VRQEDVLAAVKRGIAKVNIGTETRQAYEVALRSPVTLGRESGSVPAAQEAVYHRTTWLMRDYFGLAGTRPVVTGRATGAT
jgi:fructose/tagatose bisphosphate aldolase